MIVVVNQIITKVLEHAKHKREQAGYNGEYGDGVASILEMQVKFYNYGRENKIPPEWKDYEKQLDPEYTEYLRLKQKFGWR